MNYSFHCRDCQLYFEKREFPVSSCPVCKGTNGIQRKIDKSFHFMCPICGQLYESKEEPLFCTLCRSEVKEVLIVAQRRKIDENN